MEERQALEVAIQGIALAQKYKMHWKTEPRSYLSNCCQLPYM